MNLKLLMRQYAVQVRMGGIILVALVGILVGVVPFAQRTLSLWDQVRLLNSEVTLLQGKSATLQLLDEDELRRDALTLASVVPPDKSLSTVMTTLDTVSGQTNVALEDVSLNKPGSLATASAQKQTAEERKIGSNILSVSVHVRGTFDEIQRFISLIGVVRRLFHINNIGINFNSGLVDARLVLDTYYYPYPATVGRTLTPISGLSDDEKNIVTQMEALPLASVVPASTVSASVSVGKTDPFSL